MIEALERIVRVAGLAGLLTAWVVSGSEAMRSRARPVGRGIGLAPRLGALPTYLLGATAYFAVWVVLWDPLAGTPPDEWRLALLVVGTAFGAVGLALYLWGRLTLGAMYNVSSALGSELYGDHRLVTSGPFRYVRHPMYAGIALAAVGGLAVYRTWAMVFAVASVLVLRIKAGHEERLLAAEFGPEWHEYASRVPGWLPRRLDRPQPQESVVQERRIS